MLGCPGVDTGGTMGRGYDDGAGACAGKGAVGVTGGAGVGLDSVILPVCFNCTSLTASLEIRGNSITMISNKNYTKTFRKMEGKYGGKKIQKYMHVKAIMQKELFELDK